MKEIYDSNLYSYVKKYKLIKRNKVLFLSDKYSYYYDEKELKGIKTIVHLKKLNEIKYLNNAIKDLCNILKKNYIFCGRFVDNKSLNYYKRFFEFLNTTRSLSQRSVTSRLAFHNFKIINMTEINGITYFYAKKL